MFAVGALVTLVTLAWCTANGKWSSGDWALPIRYLEPPYADFIGGCALFKTMTTDNWIPLGARRGAHLGAPTGAEWGSSPSTNEIDLFVAAGLVRLFGLFAGFNATLLVGHLATAVACYAVARILAVDVLWSFVVAVAFGLAPYLFSQSPHHLTCQFIFYVPLFALVWRWISEPNGLVIGSRRFWCASAIAFLAGMENPYFANVFCQLTLLGGAVRSWQARSSGAMKAALAVASIAVAGFGFINLETFFHRLTQAMSTAEPIVLNREYRWMDIYGLKIVDLFIPYMTHRSEWFATFGMNHRMASVLNDEEGSAYLGILGGACLLWLVAVSVRAMVERRQADVPAAAWQVLWIVLMFTTGGLNAVIAAFTGFTLFRTACRYGVIILLLVLLWAAERLTAWGRDAAQRSSSDTVRIGSLTLAAALCLLVLWDQVPRAPTADQKTALAIQVESDRDFVRRMEDSLPKGAMIFQMPVMQYSGNAIPGVPPYDHFRPYLYSRDLKFSFGALPNQPQDEWQKTVRNQFNEGAEIDRVNEIIRFVPGNVTLAVQEMRRSGFSGLYVNRKGYADGGKGIEEALKQAGYTRSPISSRVGDLVCFVLEKG
jgi:phosphoglycerol transferase